MNYFFVAGYVTQIIARIT